VEKESKFIFGRQKEERKAGKPTPPYPQLFLSYIQRKNGEIVVKTPEKIKSIKIFQEKKGSLKLISQFTQTQEKIINLSSFFSPYKSPEGEIKLGKIILDFNYKNSKYSFQILHPIIPSKWHQECHFEEDNIKLIWDTLQYEEKGWIIPPQYRVYSMPLSLLECFSYKEKHFKSSPEKGFLLYKGKDSSFIHKHPPRDKIFLYAVGFWGILKGKYQEEKDYSLFYIEKFLYFPSSPSETQEETSIRIMKKVIPATKRVGILPTYFSSPTMAVNSPFRGFSELLYSLLRKCPHIEFVEKKKMLGLFKEVKADTLGIYCFKDLILGIKNLGIDYVVIPWVRVSGVLEVWTCNFKEGRFVKVAVLKCIPSKKEIIKKISIPLYFSLKIPPEAVEEK